MFRQNIKSTLLHFRASYYEILWEITHVRKGSQFEYMVITTDGTILTGSKIQKRLVTMILFWILGKSKFLASPGLGQKKLDQLNKDFNITTKNKKDFPVARKK